MSSSAVPLFVDPIDKSLKSLEDLNVEAPSKNTLSESIDIKGSGTSQSESDEDDEGINDELNDEISDELNDDDDDDDDDEEDDKEDDEEEVVVKRSVSKRNKSVEDTIVKNADKLDEVEENIITSPPLLISSQPTVPKKTSRKVPCFANEVSQQLSDIKKQSNSHFDLNLLKTNQTVTTKKPNKRETIHLSEFDGTFKDDSIHLHMKRLPENKAKYELLKFNSRRSTKSTKDAFSDELFCNNYIKFINSLVDNNKYCAVERYKAITKLFIAACNTHGIINKYQVKVYNRIKLVCQDNYEPNSFTHAYDYFCGRTTETPKIRNYPHFEKFCTILSGVIRAKSNLKQYNCIDKLSLPKLLNNVLFSYGHQQRYNKAISALSVDVWPLLNKLMCKYIFMSLECLLLSNTGKPNLNDNLYNRLTNLIEFTTQSSATSNDACFDHQEGSNISNEFLNNILVCYMIEKIPIQPFTLDTIISKMNNCNLDLLGLYQMSFTQRNCYNMKNDLIKDFTCAIGVALCKYMQEYINANVADHNAGHLILKPLVIDSNTFLTIVRQNKSLFRYPAFIDEITKPCNLNDWEFEDKIEAPPIDTKKRPKNHRGRKFEYAIGKVKNHPGKSNTWKTVILESDLYKELSPKLLRKMNPSLKLKKSTAKAPAPPKEAKPKKVPTSRIVKATKTKNSSSPPPKAISIPVSDVEKEYNTIQTLNKNVAVRKITSDGKQPKNHKIFSKCTKSTNKKAKSSAIKEKSKEYVSTTDDDSDDDDSDKECTEKPKLKNIPKKRRSKEVFNDPPPKKSKK